MNGTLKTIIKKGILKTNICSNVNEWPTLVIAPNKYKTKLSERLQKNTNYL